jgi:hypothetical protein
MDQAWPHGRDRVAARRGKKRKEGGREVGRWKFGPSGRGEDQLGRLRCLHRLKKKERLGYEREREREREREEGLGFVFLTL